MSQRFKLFLFDVYDIVSFLFFVGGIVLFVRLFLFQPYNVVGSSMYPTFEQNDFIIVNKLGTQFDAYKRWDIIVFVPPGKDIAYIKRVVAFPGETVRINTGGVFVCSQHDGSGNAIGSSCTALDQSYLPAGVETDVVCNRYSYTSHDFVVESGLFVMGDNRPHSTDSRCCFGIGCYGQQQYVAPFGNIVGKVLFRIAPRPTTNFSYQLPL